MKVSFNCLIKTSVPGHINKVKQLVPDISDSRASDIEYTFKEGLDVTDGTSYFSCKILFHMEDDAREIYTSIKGLEGMLTDCDSGSYIRVVKTWHDENPSNPPRPCEILLEARKD